MKLLPYQTGPPGRLSIAVLLFIVSAICFASQTDAFTFPVHPGSTTGDSIANGSLTQEQTIDIALGPIDSNPPLAVPEPATLLLFAGGLGATLLNRWRKRA